MPSPQAVAEMSVEQVMQSWPATLNVFRRRRMACIGCPVARFTSVRAAALIYNLPLDDLVDELLQAIDERQ